MSIIQQPTLFDIDYLEKLEIQEKYLEIFSPLDWTKILTLFEKDSRVGPSIKVNYEAVLRSLMARIDEKIPTQKALIQRLKSDLRLKLSVGFLYSQAIPSEATYSRVMATLANHLPLLEKMNQELLHLIHEEFAIFDENVAIDVTSIEARTKPVKTENPKLPSTEKQRTMTTEEILATIPAYASWGVKKNSQGKNYFWFGYKGTVAVSTHSQYILNLHIASAFSSDVSLAIPTIRKTMAKCTPKKEMTYFSLDKGYDAKEIYQELHSLEMEPIIPLKSVPKNEGEVDAHYAPTCLLEYSYRYDSYDKRYGALKYVRPQGQCKNCPLQHEGMCQKVIKIKQMNDPRKYNHPARGTQAWKLKYNERSSVERVNAYLKDSYQLNDTRFYRSSHAIAFYHLIQLTYNARTFANQRIAKERNEKKQS